MCWDQDSDLGRLAPLVLQTNVFDRSTIPAIDLFYQIFGAGGGCRTHGTQFTKLVLYR